VALQSQLIKAGMAKEKGHGPAYSSAMSKTVPTSLANTVQKGLNLSFTGALLPG